MKPDPISESESSESEPPTKKAKLEGPNYEDIEPKLETADPNWEHGSDVEVSTTYLPISLTIGVRIFCVLKVVCSLLDIFILTL